METYGKILIIAMPLFLLLVLFEKWYGWRKGNDTVRTMDMISSLSSGVTNSTKDVLGLSIAIISYSWMVENLTIYQVQSSWLLYVIAFIYIRLKYRFWALQPVAHFYDIYYWFIDYGIIRIELPEKNKFYQPLVKTISYEDVAEHNLTKFINFIHLN